MNKLAKKIHAQQQRKTRIRSVISGTAERPRLSVHMSNLHITAQVIDDATHKTLAYATTVGAKKLTGTMSAKAEAVGKDIAVKAKKQGVSKVAFDRGGKMYHGRIKALADAARAEGLEF